MAERWQVAWITGASSGIGRALALELARAGVRVAVSARRTDELEALASEQAGIFAFPLDVTSEDETRAVAARIEAELGPIDLAVFNAGLGEPMGVDDFDPALARQMMEINYFGLVNGVAAVLGPMRSRREGHIALMSSIAGYGGLPRAIGYSCSKAAAIALAESLALELDATDLEVSVINPGFVATPMTANAKHPLPFVISAEDAARRIVRGLRATRFEIAFPWRMKMMAKLGRIIPYPAYIWFMARQVPPATR